MYQDGDLFQGMFFQRVEPGQTRTDVMVSFLDDRGWVPASSFKEFYGWSDRECRAYAAAAQGRIISGNKGYKLTMQCTPDEFNEANGRLLSQSDRMRERAIQQARVFHKRGAE